MAGTSYMLDNLPSGARLQIYGRNVPDISHTQLRTSHCTRIWEGDERLWGSAPCRTIFIVISFESPAVLQQVQAVRL